MDPQYNMQAPSKGKKLIEECIAMGSFQAKSDLVFYHYRAMGMENDLPKSLQLMEEADSVDRDQNGFSLWDVVINRIKKEIESQEE